MGNTGYLTKEGFRNLRVNKLMSVASITVLFSCLMIIGIAFMIFVNINSLIDGVEKMNVIRVFATTDSTDYEYAALGVNLANIDNVRSVTPVDKDEDYKKNYLDKMGEEEKKLIGDTNPLNDSYRVEVEDMDGFETVVNDIKKLDGIETVYDHSSTAVKLNKIRSSVSYISIGMIILLLIVSLFIISNTIKVTMFSRRLEISIMKSVGATNSFIRWPFMVEGMIIGIISGILATGAVWAAYELAIAPLSAMVFDMGFGGTGEEISFIRYAPFIALVFILIGVLTGVIGSATSIRKYLKERKFVELED